MHSLSEMFELSPQIVHSTISKMIINEELQVSIPFFPFCREISILLGLWERRAYSVAQCQGALN